MPKALLDCVNEVLTRTGIIAGDAGDLTSLTDSPRQRAVDIAVQVINEGIDELYSSAGESHPQEQAESTITLVTGDRDYTLATDLVQLRYPLIDKTNNQYIFEYPGGYNQLLIDDPEQDDDGQPHFATISPVDSTLYLDRIPRSEENGKIYTYQYDKDLELTLSTDTVPFGNAVFRAMIPAWAQLWKLEVRKEFDKDLFDVNIGRAARFLNQVIPKTDYSPR